jgi:putative ABC transport system permease protein
MTAMPPRLARAIIAAATEPAERPWLVADLNEWYAVKFEQRGRWHADAWYCRQVARSVVPLLVRRMRANRPANHTFDPTTMSTNHATTPPEKFGASFYYLRHAFRRLVREPAFTIAAVLTLALGVGGNVAVFAVVEAVLLRPLPYPSADRLVILNHRDQRTGITKEFVAIGDYVDIVARQSSFDAVGAYGSALVTVFGDGEPYRAIAFSATDGAFTALGLRPVIGRGIQADDSRQGGPAVVMLSYAYWRDKFGSDPRVVGQSLKIGQTQRTIIGVAPEGFRFRGTKPPELLFPLVMPAQAPAGRKNGWTFVIARLKPTRTVQEATADLAKISHQLETEYPQSNLASSYYAQPLRDFLVGNTKPALILLLAAVGVVLLIACANVANLLLARSLSRRREMAVRMALGAGRGRLAAQLLSESLALAVVAGMVGIAIAYWGSHALVALVPRSVEAPGLSEVHINGAVLAFALGITMITTLTFGLVAMLTVRLDSAASVLVGSGRTSSSLGVRRIASGLVVAEVALAIVLLIGAGLITRTFTGLLSVDPGFRYDRVMTMSIAIPADRYRDTLAREGFYRSAFSALKAVPGVQEIGTAAVTPLTGNNWTVPFERTDQPVTPGERPPEVGWQVASAGFFKALSIPLIAGRLFDERDRPAGPQVAIVSDAIQKRYFPNESAIGKQLKGGNGTVEIVGVVGNIRRAGLRDEPRADLYFPFEQSPSTQTTLFVRTAGDPVKELASFQAALRSVESKTVFLESQSLADVAAESVRTTKLILWLLGVFAVTALALAAIGIYGVMSYVVRQRTREIGTRIALGATRRNIVWLIMREGGTIALWGTVAGLLVGLAAARSLNSILFGVTPSDPVTMAAATLVLVAAIFAACYVPARRAAGVDPARTLAEQ